MVVVKIRGGLGNQMFQYAFGKNLAKKLDSKLVLDLESLFNQSPRIGALPRTYLLNIFKTKPNFTLVSKICLSIKILPKSLMKIMFKIENFLLNRKVLLEKDFPPNIELPNNLDNVLLVGYWQNEKYFKEIEEDIKKDFIFIRQISPKLNEHLPEINKINSVCVHVRRGDNVLNPLSIKSFGFVGLEYYKRAVCKINDYIKNPKFFIFSDDINWCKENFNFIKNCVFVSEQNNESDPSGDLQLMSNCSNFIIANSTLSWWAAYLNKNPNKIVVAPKNWFTDLEQNNLYVNNIMIKSWITI